MMSQIKRKGVIIVRIAKYLKGAMFSVLGVLGFSSVSHAVLSADATAIFTAVDTAGISTAVSGVLAAMVGISLVFLAYRYARKAMGR